MSVDSQNVPGFLNASGYVISRRVASRGDPVVAGVGHVETITAAAGFVGGNHATAAAGALIRHSAR